MSTASRRSATTRVLVLAADRCQGPFEEATGESLLEPGGYDMSVFWGRDDTVICLVIDAAGSKLQAPIRAT
jgi:hypothetical protein